MSMDIFHTSLAKHKIEPWCGPLGPLVVLYIYIYIYIYIYCPVDYTNLETVRTNGLGLSSPILAITVSSVLEDTGKGLEFPFLLSCKISGTGAANRLETTCS